MQLGPFIYDSEGFDMPIGKAERAALSAKDPSKVENYRFDLPVESARRPVRKKKLSFQNVQMQIMKELKTLGLLNIVGAKKRIILRKAAISNSNRFTASNAAKKFYLGLGCTYLQIQGYGLFYVGSGTCPYGVTSFEPTACHVRMRLKPHGGNTSIALSLNIPCNVLDSHSPSKFSIDPADDRPFPDFFFAN
jgi:hypothetical protein